MYSILIVRKELAFAAQKFQSIGANKGIEVFAAEDLFHAAGMCKRVSFDCTILWIDTSWQEAMLPIRVLQVITKNPVLAVLPGCSFMDCYRFLDFADGCIREPDDMEECLDIAVSMAERVGHNPHNQTEPIEYAFCSGVLIVSGIRIAMFYNEEIVLGRQEFNLLLHFAKHRDFILSKDQLYKVLWPNEEIVNAYKAVSYHVQRLKRQIHSITKMDYIETVYGVGYKFHAPILSEADTSMMM